ncbi:MAG: hypothetical protein M3463_11095 [Verrucomicrobiota bacterium]|nr:hypothetical protein [Verrucomicrobiota bacterium]
MLLVTFALAEESRDFLRRVQARRRLGGGPCWQANLGGRELLIAHTGVGLESAGRVLPRLLAAHRIDQLICTGFAGGLDPRLPSGDLLVATNFSAPDAIARCRRLPHPDRQLVFGNLTSQPMPVETVAAKAQLARETGAAAVDMETAAVARICGERGVPLLAVRVISDAADEPLPAPFECCYDLVRQRRRPLALLRFLAGHPARLAPFIRFGYGLLAGRRKLAHLLSEWIQSS